MSTSTRIRDLANEFIGLLSPGQLDVLRHSAVDPEATKWTYLPQVRPGLSWADLGRRPRKAVHAMLATVLSERGFTQAVGVMAQEDVLDLREGGGRDRFSADYWTAFYGDPGDHEWRWRTEGHHFSVTVTLRGDEYLPSPVFLGLNPARVAVPGGRSLSTLVWEEQLARELLAELTPDQAALALLAPQAPRDLLSEYQTTVRLPLGELGVPAAELAPAAGRRLGDLVDLYLDRLAAPVRAELVPADLAARLSFGWAGSERVGEGHYYRIQGAGVLIEYCNTQNSANHIHSVLRLVDREFQLGDAPAPH